MRAETMKSGEERTIPFDPQGEAARLLKARRFGDAEGLVFIDLPLSKSRALKQQAPDALGHLRYPWREALLPQGCTAWGS